MKISANTMSTIKVLRLFRTQLANTTIFPQTPHGIQIPATNPQNLQTLLSKLQESSTVLSASNLKPRTLA